MAMGFDYIAIGHYARSVHEPEVQLLQGWMPIKTKVIFFVN